MRTPPAAREDDGEAGPSAGASIARAVAGAAAALRPGSAARAHAIGDVGSTRTTRTPSTDASPRATVADVEATTVGSSPRSRNTFAARPTRASWVYGLRTSSIA